MTTGLDSFDETLQTTNLLLEDIEKEMGWEGRRDQAYLALRVVLQTLRDRLTIEETADLGAQLPMLVRGFYYEGWQPAKVPERMTKEEFLGRVRKNFTYSLDGSNIEEVIRGVLNVVSRHVSQGEILDLIDILPTDIAQLL